MLQLRNKAHEHYHCKFYCHRTLHLNTAHAKLLVAVGYGNKGKEAIGYGNE